jgi:hypothetical protein
VWGGGPAQERKDTVDYSTLSDRELDALIAEKVMALTVVRVPFVPSRVQISDETVVLMDDARKEFYTAYPRAICGGRLPRYSTSIADAWQVVEKMWTECWRLHLQGYPSSWTASFDDLGETHTAEHLTAPRAICLAALKALEP